MLITSIWIIAYMRKNIIYLYVCAKVSLLLLLLLASHAKLSGKAYIWWWRILFKYMNLNLYFTPHTHTTHAHLPRLEQKLNGLN